MNDGRRPNAGVACDLPPQTLAASEVESETTPEWPRCRCHRRFPSLFHLRRHIDRDACLGEREYSILVRRVNPGARRSQAL